MHPEEKEAVRTTIVGGRPPGSGKATGEVPQGIELLVKKAAVDGAFRRRLLEARAGAARDISLALSPSEAAMLDGVPAAQLEAIIARTRVSRKVVPALLGHSAAAMLVALSAVAVVTDGCGSDEAVSRGGRPDRPEQAVQSVERESSSPATTSADTPTPPAVSKGLQPDKPAPPPAPQGIRPDAPPPKVEAAPDVEPPEEPAPAEPEPPQVKPKPAPKPPPVTRGISPDRPPVTMGIRVDRPPARRGTPLDLPESEKR